jgi:hypothetical protein
MIRNENLILFCLILAFYLVLPKKVDASIASQFEAPKGLRSLSKFLFDLKMRKSKKGQLKMEPTDPPSMEYEFQYSEKFPNKKIFTCFLSKMNKQN